MAEPLNLEKIASTPAANQAPEHFPNPEKLPERPRAEAEKKVVPVSTPATPPARNIIRETNTQTFSQRRAAEIDRILADGLEDIFLSLPTDKRQRFKASGEETVVKINKLLDSAKVKIKQIVNLIRRWLALLPGVNKYFLEQEAKLKADRILKIKS